MLTRLSSTTRYRFSRGVLAVALSLVGSTMVSSCLTPEFTFEEDGGEPVGEGGSGTGGTVALVDHCENRAPDSDETDIDCGGRDCEPCALGRSCEAGSDCVNGTCTNLKCQDPSCTDGEKNATETDEDCGGGGCPPCADTKRCEENSDCESSSCKGGVCAAPSCTDRIQNGLESDIDCGGDCDQCESGDGCVIDDDCIQPPEEDPSVSICQDFVCALVCGVGLGDCNQMAGDGCETNINTTVEHCGACEAVCAPDHATGKCVAGECAIDEVEGCTGAWLDCNGMPDDGCEVNSNTNVSHCGTCFSVCSDANGEPSCDLGTCSIACADGFENCDDDAKSNGCEINIDSNTLYCGGCEASNECPDGTSQQSPHCTDGTCGLTDCPAGMGDCDGDGNCTNQLNTNSNCGSCGNSCSATNATTSCIDQGGGDYACAVNVCVDGGGSNWENCDGLYANGCESNVNSDPTNCGACVAQGGQNCSLLRNNASLQIASISCTTGTCVITGCNGDYRDCDGNPNNGCEVNTATDTVRCGGCLPTDPNPGTNDNCSTKYPHATGTCSGSLCQFQACADSNWGNCTGGTADGCETDLRVTQAHCGTCNSACQTNAYTTSNACSAKNCTATCNSNGAQCDANQRNGCENINTSATNCGTCGNVCGGNGTNVDTATCVSKVCDVECTNNLCPDATAAAACTLSLGTTSNCSYCGEVCGPAAEFCTPSGCLDHLQIEMVNSGTTGTGNSSGTISVNHTLATARATNNTRTVVVLVGYDGNAVDLPPTVTYAGAAMTVAEHLYSGNQTWVGIYYMLDATLPSTAGVKSVVVTANSSNTHGLTARVVELINVDQSAPLGPKASRVGQQGCTGPDAGRTTAQPLTSLAPDSWVFSAFAINADVSIPVTGSQEALGVLYFGGTAMNSGYVSNVSPSTTPSWSCSGSIANWSHAVVAFQPDGTD